MTLFLGAENGLLLFSGQPLTVTIETVEDIFTVELNGIELPPGTIINPAVATISLNTEYGECGVSMHA